MIDSALKKLDPREDDTSRPLKCVKQEAAQPGPPLHRVKAFVEEVGSEGCLASGKRANFAPVDDQHGKCEVILSDNEEEEKEQEEEHMFELNQL